MTVSVVLFDLGGVVFQFRPADRLRLLSAASPLSEAEIEAALWGSGFSAECDRGIFSAEEQAAESRARARLALDDRAIREAWVSAFEPDTAVVRIVEELIAGLGAGSPVRVGSFSNNSALIRSGMEATWPALMARFSPSVWAYEARATKPDAQAYAFAAARAGVPGDEICFIDDSAGNARGAAEAGWDAIHFTDAEALRRALEARGLFEPRVG